MPTKTILSASSWLILPVMFGFFYVLRVATQGHAIDRWFPDWYAVSVITTMFVLERIYRYRYAVNQKPLLKRDLTATVVNLYATGAVLGFFVTPALLFALQHLFGRKTVFASPEQLGPFWLQMIVIALLVSFFRYWMHRWQHKNEFLWKLHSYHHRVSDLQATNVLVSHPLDFALRNVLVFLILAVIGFYPLAIVLTVPGTQVSGFFSHCGADVKMGFLNYFFVTPEVHRWHHTAEVPEGHRYSVNYGVEFSFWDVLFGTFHLPQDKGYVVPPKRLGHPSGFADESNYFRLFLAPFGLYRPLSWFKRTPKMAGS